MPPYASDTIRWLSLAALTALPACAGSATSRSPGTVDEDVDPVAALAAAWEAVAADESDAEAWYGLGLAWQDSREPGAADSAAAAFDRALGLDEGHVKAWVHRGLTLEELGRQDEALSAYTRAVELAPEDPLPLINRGSILYFHFKRNYEAKVALTRALELDPDNADAHFNLGVMFADANMFEEARREWERVLELDPEGPAGNLARDNLARVIPLLEPPEPAGTTDAEEE